MKQILINIFTGFLLVLITCIIIAIGLILIIGIAMFPEYVMYVIILILLLLLFYGLGKTFRD